MTNYSLNVWEISDFSGALGNPANATQITPYFAINTSSTLSNTATPQTIGITDDDGIFEDAFQETGSQSVLTQDITVNGQTFFAGQSVELEYSLETTDVPSITIFVGRIGNGPSNSGSNQLVFSNSTLTPGQTYHFCDGDYGAETPYDDIVCFADGTLIETPTGFRTVDELVAGDLVVTRDHGIKPIQWIGSKKVCSTAIVNRRELAPVIIDRDALGEGLPITQLRVSQQHRVSVSDWRLDLAFGYNEMLVPAKALVNGTTVRLAMAGDVEYYHMMFDEHVLVNSNGHWTESLLYAEHTLSTLTPSQVMEMELLFPDLEVGKMETALPVARVGEYNRAIGA